MKTLKTLLLASVLLAFVACSEEDAMDNTKLLTSKTWTYDAISGYDDFTNSFADALLTGSTYKFNSDGTVISTLIGVSDSGNWEFNSDGTIITLEPGTADSEEWTVITLNSTTLKISAEDNSALDGTYSLTFK